MSAVQKNAEALTSLGAGDVVSVIEDVKRTAHALAEEIDRESGGTPEERINELLERTCKPSEELLALVYPTIEYGDAQAIETIPRALLHVAGRTAAVVRETGPNRIGGVVVVGRLVWAIVAYAVHCGRFEVIADASRASVIVPFSNNEAAPLIGVGVLRYPDALGGNAGRSFEAYREWLQTLQLITERYPLLVAEFDHVFGEADVLLAMVMARQRDRVYSLGLDTASAGRLARRLRDPKHRAALRVVFDSSKDELDDALERAYARLETDQHRWDRPPTKLFAQCE